jgi:muramidase (phage lysozyme)
MTTALSPEQLGGKNVAAFMDMLASSVAEGTSSSPITKNNGYDIIVTGVDGRNRFDDYTAHPFANGRSSIVVNSHGLTSNASGRYQFMLKDWAHYRDLLMLPDFGRASQDRWCLQLIKERGAIPQIIAGHLDLAVARCCNIWASLPGNNYGQHQAKIEALRSVFVAAGGSLA